MLKVGITGGIGAGKSTVSAIFEVLGIPVLYADDVAKSLMETDEALIAGIKKLGGDALYYDGHLDRKALSGIIFSDAEKISALNALIHPATIRYAEQWFATQHSPFAIKEAALFFESKSNAGIHKMIGVSAPEEIRIARVIARSGMSQGEVLARMAKQLPEEGKMSRCDYIIINDGANPLMPQVLALHQNLLAAAAF